MKMSWDDGVSGLWVEFFKNSTSVINMYEREKEWGLELSEGKNAPKLHLSVLTI
jgi:hypothetical protein